jgi:2-keto-4-pentenoate hydratase/2-oxohepta-3-ene-1,7-dioic acid hydratase in catechol pathway
VRLASYRSATGEHFGAVAGDGLVDLGKRLPRYPTLRALIAADGLAEARAALAGAAAPDQKLADVELLPPVVAPEKIWCIGVNYADRNEEYKDNSERPKYPSLFCRAPASLVGHAQPIERPRVSAQLDYEGEIALVIGRGGRHIPRERALEHVFGVTLCNEGTVRDWLRHGKFNVTQGKNFDRSGSIGPWIVTSDEIDPARPLRLTTHVNGETRQDDSTANLLFSFPELIAYITTFTTLKPGDVIVTGTPVGAGARFDPPRWLVPGDVVEVSVPEIGTLRNTVMDEA